MLTEHVTKAHAAGLKVGVYLFVNPGRDAESQAQYFWNAVKSLPLDCRLSVDYETRTSLTREQNTALAKALLDRVKQLSGKEVVLYTYTNFARDCFSSALSPYKLWIAHYGVDTPGDNGVWEKWTGFQYSSTGTVPGISGAVDLDEFTTDILLPGVQAPSGPTVTADVYPVAALPYAANAKASAAFDVCNRDGSVVKGRKVYKDDAIAVLDCVFDRQLLEVVYPTASGWVHGYIANRPGSLRYTFTDAWKNGSTNEPVYGVSNPASSVGTIYPREKATPLYRKSGMLALCYNTSKGTRTKIGLVKYAGGFTKL